MVKYYEIVKLKNELYPWSSAFPHARALVNIPNVQRPWMSAPPPPGTKWSETRHSRPYPGRLWEIDDASHPSASRRRVQKAPKSLVNTSNTLSQSMPKSNFPSAWTERSPKVIVTAYPTHPAPANRYVTHRTIVIDASASSYLQTPSLMALNASKSLRINTPRRRGGN